MSRETCIFDVRPFDGAGPLRFGMTSNEVRYFLGEPRNVRRNRRGELDEDYSGASAGYSVNDERLVEIGFVSSSSVRFRGIDLFNDESALSTLVDIDGAPLSGLGFIVFPSLGIALADFHSAQESDRVVTIYAHGRWANLDEFVPFLERT